MNKEIDKIVSWKNDVNQFGINGYVWFFNELENNYLSKMDGTKRNASLLEDYNEEAQNYILMQLYYLREDAAVELMKEIGINEPSVSKENEKHIEKNMN